jgi:hypothetical protein
MMTTNPVEAALFRVRCAVDIRNIAQAEVHSADRALADLLTGNDILVSGHTTHERRPPSADREHRRRFVDQPAHVLHVNYDSDNRDPRFHDRMQVKLPDGSTWLMPVRGTSIEIVSERQPV